jgi:hypothetical protein
MVVVKNLIKTRIKTVLHLELKLLFRGKAQHIAGWVKIKICIACADRYLFPHFYGIAPLPGAALPPVPPPSRVTLRQSSPRNFCNAHDKRHGEVSPFPPAQASRIAEEGI